MISEWLLDTAFINTRGSWMYCEDSRITSTDERKVVVSIFVFVD